MRATVLDDVADGIGGPLARARAGDILLENEHLRLVLEQPGRSWGINPYGGNAIDLDIPRDGPGEDRLGEVGLYLNLAFTAAPDTVEIVSDGRVGKAVVRFSGPIARSDFANPVVAVEDLLGVNFPIDPFDPPEFWVTLTWSLAEDASFAHLEVEVENRGEAEEPLMPAWLSHGGIAEPFDPATGGWTRNQLLQTSGVLYADDVLAYAMAPLPYSENHGWASMAGGAVLIPEGSVLDVFGWPGSAPVHLEHGESYAFEAVFTVASSLSDVQATLRSFETGGGEEVVSGSVSVEGTGTPIHGARVVALAEDGIRVLASDLTEPDGSYELSVPDEPYSLVAGKTGWPYDGGGSTPAPSSAPDLTLPPTGALAITATGSSGPLPAHVTVVGIDPSPPHPALQSARTDPLPPGVSAIFDLDVTGGTSVDLEPGSYDVVVTRGMEYDAVRTPITVEAGATTDVSVTLHRVLDTIGMVSGDFHVHSAAGPDTALTDEKRVANFAAEGVEVLVASDHAYVADLAPVVDALELGDWVTSIPSQEVTTTDYGHFGLFPLPVDESRADHGALAWPGMTPVEIFDWGWQQQDEVVVQINHPRAIPTPGNFQHYFGRIDLRFGPDGPYTGPDAMDPVPVGLPPDAVLFGPGFTAIEAMTWLNVQGLSDWFNLLNAGWRVTATANSDTHTVRVESSGWPRNFVEIGHDDPAEVDPLDFARAVNAGQLAGSFGPLVTLSAENAAGDLAGMGDTLDAGGGVTVSVRVQAAPWVDVDTLDVYVGGEMVLEEALVMEPVAQDGGTRLETTVDLALDVPADTWVVAIAHGEASLWPYVPFHRTDPETITLASLRADEVTAPATPFGFANPVFLDADGDGEVAPSFFVVEEDWTSYRREDRLDPY